MLKHNRDDMFHKRVFHLMCSCFRLPDAGNFTVGQEYTFENTADIVGILDDLGQVIVFNKKVFESCFYNFADPVYPVPDLGFMDKTIYHLYFVLDQDCRNLETYKAYSKLFNVNYMQAKGILNDKRVLIAMGNIYDIKEILNKLKHFQVHYEISPPYPYQF